MMNITMGIILTICILPTIWMMFLLSYPKDLRSSKLIFGVKNRDEFAGPEVRENVEGIITKYRTDGQRMSWILTAVCGIIFLLTFIDKLSLVTFVWIMYTFASIFLIMIPFLQGHREMMIIKRNLGLSTEKGVSYVDLKNAGAVRVLGIRSVLVPNIIGLILVAIAFLRGAGILDMGKDSLYPGFVTGMMVLTFWLMGVLITVFGFVMDRIKNEVISTDSDVNANYNRAKKKTLASLMIAFLWFNTLFVAAFFTGLVFTGAEALYMFSIGVYMLLVMGALLICISRMRRIDEAYRTKTDIVTDDDEYWIGGLIYYNPSDKRLNIEKRVGVGGTVNMAHPVGKALGVLSALAVLVTLLCVVWIGMLEATPISLRVEDGSLICHQLRDEYVIPLDTIESAEYIQDIRTLRLSRSSGVGMNELLKGDFVELNSVTRCKVFLNPETGSCIHIETSDRVYYVSSDTPEETTAIWNMLKDLKN